MASYARQVIQIMNSLHVGEMSTGSRWEDGISPDGGQDGWEFGPSAGMVALSFRQKRPSYVHESD
jgi:hypothetical protein